MAKVTKRIAKSGATVDGRKLPKDTLQKMAGVYDRAVYAAKLNIEHYVSVVPDSIFSEQGDVFTLKTEPAPNNEIYLLAEMETSSQVDDMWAKGKKRAFSIEYDPNFADLGSPYLVGLAVTSYPASLGTHFSLQEKFSAKPATGKERFTFYESSVDTDHANYTVEHFSMTTATADDKNQPSPQTQPATPATAAQQPAMPEQFSQSLQHFSAELAAVRTERDKLKTELAKQAEDFSAQLAAQATEHATALAAKDAEIDELKGRIPADGYTPRPKTTGAEGKPATRY